MGYSNEVIQRASRKLADLREERASLTNARRAQAYSLVPQLRDLDGQMRRNMAQAAMTAFSSQGPAAMEEAREKNKALEEKRRALLDAHFPPDFWVEGPLCAACGDTGYVGAAMCRCLKDLCIREQLAGMGRLFAGPMDFDTFRTDWYSDRADPKIGAAPRTVMERVLKKCREYARTFTPDAPNLLFNGGTGLGKTHLAVSVGRAVAKMGYGVCYESAGGLFAKLEAAKFSPTEESQRAARTLERCDLLILDDLGTEMPGQFVQAALYQLLNTRLTQGLPTVITTNLTVDEAAKRYSPQVASRLYGDFLRLTFVGEDNRRRA